MLCSEMDPVPENLTTISQADGRGSVTLTEGIEVTVSPSFLPEHSDPESGRWIFAYQVVIENRSKTAWTLRSRHWLIIDGDGEQHDVRGPGVVGLQPKIDPGSTFSYSSFCPLPTAWGTMEGSFLLQDEAGSELIARISRFFLSMD
ncbi:MAG: Co2+/Mg2+ efflux protein ApaG [Phycisphaerales bacterium]|nr:Co2+/Mg2+ efflux protein ApaG [Phycisphaerales bacterium]